jgi:ferredoxin
MAGTKPGKRRARIIIDAERCQKCGNCVDICPEDLFIQPDPGDVPSIPRQRRCTSCGHCVSLCPTAAIDHVDFPEYQ